MSAVSAIGEQRILMRNVGWGTYLRLSQEREGAIPRMTYDQGELELMSPMRSHEQIHRLIGRLVETYSEVRNINICSVASTTFKRSDLARAFEADESYYIQNVAAVETKEDIDLSIDPPPDLVVEVEITSSAIRKIPLFVAMGVPEVWRHDGEALRMNILHAESYREVDESLQLPGLTAQMIDFQLGRRYQINETKMIREFRRSLGG